MERAVFSSMGIIHFLWLYLIGIWYQVRARMTVGVTQLQMKLRVHEIYMIKQGLVNREFIKLLRDAVVPTVHMGWSVDMPRASLNKVSRALEKIPANFETVEFYVGLEIGCSKRVGDARIANTWFLLKNYSKAHDLQGCVVCVRQLKDEYSVLKNNLEHLLTLHRAIEWCRVTIPMLDQKAKC